MIAESTLKTKRRVKIFPPQGHSDENSMEQGTCSWSPGTEWEAQRLSRVGRWKLSMIKMTPHISGRERAGERAFSRADLGKRIHQVEAKRSLDPLLMIPLTKEGSRWKRLTLER